MNPISVYIHHTNELKFRMLYIGISIMSCIVLIGWYFPEMVYISIKPLFFSTVDKSSIHHLLITSFIDIFYLFIYFIKFVFFIYFILVVPYHILAFIKSGLTYALYERCSTILVQSSILFIVSISIIHTFFLQNILTFFIFLNNTLLNTAFISMQPKLVEYIHFIYTVYIMLFILFQLPIIINNVLFFNISFFKRNLKSYRKYIYFVFLLFATAFTPPDIVSQLFFYLFYIVVFECSFFIQIWNQKYFKYSTSRVL